MINITNKISDYINDQNNDIWNMLNDNYEFQLYHDNAATSWKVRTENNVATIICPNLEINYSSFTHELLHVYIEYLGMTTYQTLENYFSDDILFNNIIFHNLFAYIYNFSCHKKMFQYFKKLGFSEYEFVESRIDYNLLRHWQIMIFLKIRRLKLFGIEQYLGNFFALKNNVVPEDNSKCERYLKKLKKILPELYRVGERFDHQWSVQEDLNFIAPFAEFLENFKDWMVKNYSRKQGLL